MKELVGYGIQEKVWNVNRNKILKYQQEIWHEGLKEHKVLSAPDYEMLENKVRIQADKWNENWILICDKKQKEDMKKASAEESLLKTSEAEKELKDLENLLLYTLEIDDKVDWETLKKKDVFSEPLPKKPIMLKEYSLPIEPSRNTNKYQPKLNFLTRLIKPYRERAIFDAETLYNLAYNDWCTNVEKTISRNKEILESNNSAVIEHKKQLELWELNRAEFFSMQNEFNKKIEDLKKEYTTGSQVAILEYCEMVLNQSNLPDFIHKDFELDYNPSNKILIIDYRLPNIDVFPSLKEVKYIASKNEMKESFYNDMFMEKLYDSTLYKFSLRVLHEEFEADVINAIEAVTFNGWVNFLNKATGLREEACIISIQAKKDIFININLKNVDPKACFKNLKGIGSAKLAGITPIAPILTIDKTDRRFVESHNVTHTFDDSTNLAAIDWEEFEHLIREVFAAEFASNGGEVKITQASRDAGVDAVAFDPDPIRGGKIVIQAKRYTNTVGVSAVRDLYGTVMNEGAIKGILVTTADYGPDAYEFVKNKPLTLLNGGHLLHLLEKHGHKVKIDLKEAKLINALI